MLFTKPTPPEDALAFANKVLVGSPMSSAEWQDVPAELRMRAFFSSEVESAQFLQQARDGITDFLANNLKTLEDGQTMLAAGSRAQFVDQMQQFLTLNGVERGEGGLTDITSQARLGLIFNTQVQQADDYGYWKQGMDQDVLDEFPAQRFIRVRDVKEPRTSHARYEDQVFLKTDPIWELQINEDFGVPWGPWAWGCGHDVEDVDRDEAESLKLIAAGEQIKPVTKYNFNTGLSASTKNLDPDLLAKLKKVFGNQIVIKGDTMHWNSGPVETPAPAPAVERDSPVSAALQVKVSGSLRDEVKVAINAIDQVHDDGTLPQIPVLSTRQSALGFLSYTPTARGYVTDKIGIRSSGKWPALTAVHEAGHFLDLEAIGDKGRFATLAGDLDMKAVLAAAAKTDAIQGLRSRLDGANNVEVRRGFKYLLKDQEIWARAYAQYITEKSGSPILARQLKEARDLDPGRQWDTADFAPVADAIDAMFQKLGWL